MQPINDDTFTTFTPDFALEERRANVCFTCEKPSRLCLLFSSLSLACIVSWLVIMLYQLYTLEINLKSLHTHTTDAFETLHGDSLALSEKLSYLDKRLDIQYSILLDSATTALLEQRQIYNITSTQLQTLSRQMQNVIDVGNRNVDKFSSISSHPGPGL